MNDKKQTKKKGIFRSGFIFPVIIFICGILIFNFFFLDSLLKKGLEVTLTQMNEAEVNVGSFDTSFKDLSLEIKNIQITNKEYPKQNALVVGNVNLSLTWDALLRGKILIEESSILNIEVNKIRNRPGRVLTKEEGNDQIKKDISSKTTESAEIVKEEFKGNVLGDLASLFTGGTTSELTKEMEANLKSKKRFEEINIELKERKEAIDKSIASLPTNDELKALEKRAAGINLNDLKNLLKAPKIIKDIEKLKKDVDGTLKKYSDVEKNVTSTLKYLENAPKGIDKLIQEDIQDAQKRMNLPKLDSDTIAKVVLGEDLVNKIDHYKTYLDKLKEYLPPPKTKEEKEAEIKPKARGEGINYSFGTVNTYPLFWLKLAKINSQTDQGEMVGELLNLTNDQKLTNKTTNLNLSGDFIQEEVGDLKLSLSIDHRDGVYDQLKIDVGRYPVRERDLLSNDDLVFMMKDSVAKTSISAVFEEKEMDLKIYTDFNEIDYNYSAKNKDVESLLADIAKRGKGVNLDARGSGPFNRLKWNVKSNFSSIVQTAVSHKVQGKINEANAKIKSQIEGEVKKHRDKFNNEYAKIKTEVDKNLKKGKSELDKIKKKIPKI